MNVVQAVFIEKLNIIDNFINPDKIPNKNQTFGGPMAMQIIKAEIKHLELLTPLFDSYRAFYKQESNMELARSFLKDRLSNQESTIYLALNENSEALGFTQLYPSFSSVSAKKLWILNDLFVTPEARKLGVAQALINEATELAKETNSKGLTLMTDETNKKAQTLYEKLGWIKESGYFHYNKSV